MTIDTTTAVQNTGILKDYIQKNSATKKKENNLEKTFQETTETISSVKETDSKTVRGYNLDGHYREDYDTEKHLDIFA